MRGRPNSEIVVGRSCGIDVRVWKGVEGFSRPGTIRCGSREWKFVRGLATLPGGRQDPAPEEKYADPLLFCHDNLL